MAIQSINPATEEVLASFGEFSLTEIEISLSPMKANHGSSAQG